MSPPHSVVPARVANRAAIRADRLTKTYGSGASAVVALDDVTTEFADGRFTAIMGPSGSGKSTLMNLLAGLDEPTGGQAWIGDIVVSGLDEDGLTALRRTEIGFIFQQFNLLPTLTVLENVLLPQQMAGRPVDDAWLASVVDAVGLADRLGHRPSELSGGQQQRVACARALLGRPSVIFADEPTGALDSRAGTRLLSLLQESVREFGQTIVMVTHDPAAAACADRVVFLADGRVVSDIADPTAERVLNTLGALTPRS